MVNTSGLHYTGLIPKQPSGSVIHYYLYAADKSGHNATLPIMGPADPFTFTAIYTDITAIPDTLYFETYDDAYNGKISHLHNFTAGGINMTSLDTFGSPWGGTGAWIVSPDPFPSFPSLISSGDSVPVHVKFVIGKSGANGYYIDTLAYATELGQHRIILMVNDTLDLSLSSGDNKGSAVSLFGNFPNPFTQSTTIRYRLPERSDVKLEVMSTYGTKVTTLVDEEQDEGAYNVTFKSGELPSGIYFLEMTTDKETITKKMLLIR